MRDPVIAVFIWSVVGVWTFVVSSLSLLPPVGEGALERSLKALRWSAWSLAATGSFLLGSYCA
jgi:hypothetical protein